jgi:uncharacterized OB-fold protein
MFTIVTEPFRGMLVEPPYVLTYVLLDGADTACAGYLVGLDLTDVAAAAAFIATGARVNVRFSAQPVGRITDFWFEMVEE